MVDVSSRVIRVLGQNFATGATPMQMAMLEQRIASGSTVPAVVNGKVDRTGVAKARTMSLYSAQYVPGSSSVFVIGKVTLERSSVGSLNIGGLKVDYSALLSSGSVQIREGQTVAVIGVQSAPNMPLVASALRQL
jgi:hypothetical protein